LNFYQICIMKMGIHYVEYRPGPMPCFDQI
jgi:hypothetical protein